MRRSNQSVCCFSKVDGVILFRTLQNKNRSRKKVFIFIFHVTTKSTYDTNAWTHKVKCGSKREKKRVNDSYLNEMQTKSIYFVNHTCWRQQIHTHYSSSCRTAQHSAKVSPCMNLFRLNSKVYETHMWYLYIISSFGRQAVF